MWFQIIIRVRNYYVTNNIIVTSVWHDNICVPYKLLKDEGWEYVIWAIINYETILIRGVSGNGLICPRPEPFFTPSRP